MGYAKMNYHELKEFNRESGLSLNMTEANVYAAMRDLAMEQRDDGEVATGYMSVDQLMQMTGHTKGQIFMAIAVLSRWGVIGRAKDDE